MSTSATNIGRCSIEVPTKPLSRVERTKSFLKASLIKKWKSSKELFTRPISSFTSNDNNSAKSQRKKIESNGQHGKFINDKVLDNLDEFERNFLLSAGRKILVRELRKNFEKPQQSSIAVGNYKSKSTNTTNTCEKIKNNNSNSNNKINTKPKKKFSDACVQTNSIYNDRSDYEIISAWDECVERKKNPIVSRHSFYNTYRNEYCSSQNNHYASNLSLISCGIASNAEKTLERTINKYKNSIKSSSAVDLTSISSVVLNTTAPSSIQQLTEENRSGSTLKRHYSSIISISHTNSNENLTNSPVIEYNTNSFNDNSTNTYAMISSQRMNLNKNCQLKQTYSTKSLNIMPSSTIYDATNNNIGNNIYYCNNGNSDDTKSLIIASTQASSNLYDNNAIYSNVLKSKNSFGGSTITLTSLNNNNNNNNNINNYNPLINCHRINDNNNTIKINANYDEQDGNNNNTTTTAAITTKVRKSYSINQIDLSLLKNELDEYIDRELRATNFGRNTLAQRRYQYEYGLKKVKKLVEKRKNHKCMHFKTFFSYKNKL